MAHHQFVFIAFIPLIFVLFTICLALDHANGDKEYPDVDKQTWREFEEFRKWKKWRKEFDSRRDPWNHDGDDLEVIEDINNSKKEQINWSLQDIPPADQPALVGRYVVNQANWTSVATISCNKEIVSYPFANVVAVSDGLVGNGSGIPYMYLTPFDFTGKDIDADPRATLMMTLAEGSYCQEKQMDPIDPRCARIILSGKIKKISLRSLEHEIAKNAVFGRHPGLINMPTDHQFYFAKLKIGFIAVLDTYGGAKYVSVKDYLYPPALMHKSLKPNYYKQKVESSISKEWNVY